NSIGILAEGLLGHADTTINQGWNTALPGQIFQVATSQTLERWTASAGGNWRPAGFLTVRAVVGLDRVRQQDQQLERAGEGPAFGGFNTGFVRRGLTRSHRYTVGLTAAAAYTLAAGVTGRTTAGIQYFKHVDDLVDSTGQALQPGDT